MSVFKCENKNSCPIFALVASLVIGIAAAILQALGVIVTEPYFLFGALITALVYLAVLLISVTINAGSGKCTGTTLFLLIAGILGTVLFSGLLLAAVAPASVLGIILVGLLLFFVSLTLISTGCYIKCIADE